MNGVFTLPMYPTTSTTEQRKLDTRCILYEELIGVCEISLFFLDLLMTKTRYHRRVSFRV